MRFSHAAPSLCVVADATDTLLRLQHASQARSKAAHAMAFVHLFVTVSTGARPLTCRRGVLWTRQEAMPFPQIKLFPSQFAVGCDHLGTYGGAHVGRNVDNLGVGHWVLSTYIPGVTCHMLAKPASAVGSLLTCTTARVAIRLQYCCCHLHSLRRRMQTAIATNTNTRHFKSNCGS